MSTMLFVPTQPERTFRDALAEAVDKIAKNEGGQEKAALKIGIGQSAVSDILNKKREPRIAALIAIRSALGISIDEVLGLPPIGGQGVAPMPEFAQAVARAVVTELDRREVEAAPTPKRRLRGSKRAAARIRERKAAREAYQRLAVRTKDSS